MKKKIIGGSIILLILVIGGIVIGCNFNDNKSTPKTLTATVIGVNDGTFTVQDSNNIIYTFGLDDNSLEIGEVVKL